jgi:hypothetical protein
MIAWRCFTPLHAGDARLEPSQHWAHWHSQPSLDLTLAPHQSFKPASWRYICPVIHWNIISYSSGDFQSVLNPAILVVTAGTIAKVSKTLFSVIGEVFSTFLL